MNAIIRIVLGAAWVLGAGICFAQNPKWHFSVQDAGPGVAISPSDDTLYFAYSKPRYGASELHLAKLTYGGAVVYDHYLTTLDGDGHCKVNGLATWSDKIYIAYELDNGSTPQLGGILSAFSNTGTLFWDDRNADFIPRQIVAHNGFLAAIQGEGFSPAVRWYPLAGGQSWTMDFPDAIEMRRLVSDPVGDVYAVGESGDSKAYVAKMSNGSLLYSHTYGQNLQVSEAAFNEKTHRLCLFGVSNDDFVGIDLLGWNGGDPRYADLVANLTDHSKIIGEINISKDGRMLVHGIENVYPYGYLYAWDENWNPVWSLVGSETLGSHSVTDSAGYVYLHYGGYVVPGIHRIRMSDGHLDSICPHVDVNFFSLSGICFDSYSSTCDLVRADQAWIEDDARAGGMDVRGYLNLDGPAVEDQTWELTSSDPAIVKVQASVTIPVGQASQAYVMRLSRVQANTSVVITARRKGLTVTGKCLVLAPFVFEVKLAHDAVQGGDKIKGTLWLQGTAPPGGWEVRLTSDCDAIHDGTVIVPEGEYKTDFELDTDPVVNDFRTSISSGRTETPIRVLAPTFNLLNLSKDTIKGGWPVSMTLGFSGNVAQNARVETYSGAQDLVHLPEAVWMPAGTNSKTVTVTTSAVTVSTAVTIVGSYGGNTISRTLTLNP